MEKLPKRFKERWIKALRSGKYQQNHNGYLKDDEDQYCCLGVAAELCKVKHFGQNGWLSDANVLIKPPKLLIEDGEQDITDIDRKNITIPEKLAYFNDQGKSFKWIASYIERWL